MHSTFTRHYLVRPRSKCGQVIHQRGCVAFPFGRQATLAHSTPTLLSVPLYTRSCICLLIFKNNVCFIHKEVQYMNQKQNGSCIFQTSVEVTFLWCFFFFFLKQILTCLHLLWAMMAKGRDHVLWSFLGTAECLYCFSPSNIVLFFLWAFKNQIKSKKARYIYIVFLWVMFQRLSKPLGFK